jgi:Na+-transporting methylmalonyl-CoA/oxaloacetate decarboxylase gamma subunit
VLPAVWFVLAGMAIVFATLGALMLVITLLNRVLGPEEKSPVRNA